MKQWRQEIESIDQFIQKEYFTRKGHLALVIDPKKNTLGFFETDKDSGGTPEISGQFIAVKNDKDLVKLLAQMQTKCPTDRLPPSEIALQGGA